MQSANPASKAIDKLFFEHPRNIEESYLEHAGHAGFIGTRLLLAGFACLIHGVLPGLFVRTASNTLDNVIALMAKRSRGIQSSSQSTNTMMEYPSN